jgi:hypothetical protein
VLLEGVDACVRLFLEIGTTSGDGSERMKRLGSSTCCEKFGKQNSRDLSSVMAAFLDGAAPAAGAGFGSRCVAS